ncbi:MAG: metal ABC transporter ATP-binding protein [Desulfobulbaceae bacterium]|uniref:Metal ABC transporter ATP-binding protein n=1 Tax=Candidatus Desulfatifera sulfidica TaxID=2841691 RepID=A0A8J6TAG4_9BACT|nr:metal ABC transporter ATP-binding protein [Candidatus Desulfatifera sulfidica]
MPPEPPIIQCEGVSFAYGDVPILTNVSFTVDALDAVSLVGPNGGGKSTLLKIILGLLTPQQGAIKVFGTSPKRARGRIGYMPQYLQYDANFPVSVMEVVLMGRARPGWAGLGRYSREDRNRCLEIMVELGVESLAPASFSELSGGQRQRVLIARALACEPELLLLDEPTANVDPAVEFQFFEILKQLSHRVTVMTVSHDLGFVSQLVNRVFCINHGLKIHPTSELTGELIREMYGADVRMVRHDHTCGKEGHSHDRIF